MLAISTASSSPLDPNHYPAITSLRLSEAELGALSVRGSVSCESRGKCTVYKLRFRLEGRQHVRYLGSSTSAAQPFMQELDRLQRLRHLELQGRNWDREIKRFVRTAKQRIEPLLPADMQFHGFQTRCRRRAKSSPGMEPIMSEQTDSMQGPLEEKPKPQHPDEFSLRRERIEEYVLQALSSSSTTQAVLGAMNGDLMLYALAIREAVDDSITSGPKSLESLTPLLPPIAAYTRAARQIDRFTKTLDQLQKREEGGGPAEEAKN